MNTSFDLDLYIPLNDPSPKAAFSKASLTSGRAEISRELLALHELTSISSETSNVSGVNDMQYTIGIKLEKLGFEIERKFSDQGAHLLHGQMTPSQRTRTNKKCQSVTLICHADTVLPNTHSHNTICGHVHFKIDTRFCNKIDREHIDEKIKCILEKKYTRSPDGFHTPRQACVL